MSEQDDRPVFNLFIAVPGMGARAGEKQVLSKFIPMAEWFNTDHCCEQLRATMLSEVKKIDEFANMFKHVNRPNFGADWASSFEVAGVDFSTTIREDYGMDSLLNKITPKTGVPFLRQLGNQTLLDVLMYSCSVKVSQQIRNEVVKQCNRIHQETVEQNPDKRIVTSIIAHSLGTVIMYDIIKQKESHDSLKEQVQNARVKVQGSVTNTTDDHIVLLDEDDNQIEVKDKEVTTTIACEELEFDIEYVFLLGSPLGMFLAIREGSADGSQYVPSSKTLFERTHAFHIFHPYDTIAYRLEPLLDSRFEDIPPVILNALDLRKRSLSKGTVTPPPSVFTRITDVIEGLTFKPSSSMTEEQREAISDFGVRLDYTTQPDKLLINEYLVTGEVHLKYWSNAAVIHFILEKLGYV